GEVPFVDDAGVHQRLADEPRRALAFGQRRDHLVHCGQTGRYEQLAKTVAARPDGEVGRGAGLDAAGPTGHRRRPDGRVASALGELHAATPAIWGRTSMSRGYRLRVTASSWVIVPLATRMDNDCSKVSIPSRWPVTTALRSWWVLPSL